MGDAQRRGRESEPAVAMSDSRVAAASPSAADTGTGLDASLLEAWDACRKLAFAAGRLPLDPAQPLRVFFSRPASEASTPAAAAAGVVAFPLALDPAAAASTPAELIKAAEGQLQALIDAALPAPFGRGRETVHDASVRTALELPASHVAVTAQLPPPEVLEQVRLLLQPSAKAVLADFYKLNIYTKGGFFKAHFDTPRTPDMFGTLVVCLPSPFTGGQLELRHIQHSPPSSGSSNDARTSRRTTRSSAAAAAAPATSGASHTFDWSLTAAGSGGGPAAWLREAQWAAFYADSEHEVLPVEQGCRVTLTFNLRAVQHDGSDQAAAEQAAEADEGSSKQADEARQEQSWMSEADRTSSSSLADQIRELLANRSWHKDGDTLGFVLQHKYSRQLRTLAGLSFPSALKGPDRQLYAALEQAGLQPRVVPLFRGWSGSSFIDAEDEEEVQGEIQAWYAEHPRNFGRPLQPAQQVPGPEVTYSSARTGFRMITENLEDVQEHDYWQLMVADFTECAASLDRGYVEDTLVGDGAEYAQTVEEAYNAREADVAWVTPVLDEHFTYHSIKMAGANCAYEMCFNSTVALLVEVPAWGEGVRAAVARQGGAKAQRRSTRASRG